jgi:hypothetical protein
MRSIISLASSRQLCSLERRVNSTTTDIAEHEEKAVCPSPPDAVRHIPAMPSNALAELAAKMKSLASPRLAMASSSQCLRVSIPTVPRRRSRPVHIHRSRNGSSACLSFRTDRCWVEFTSRSHKTFSPACHESHSRIPIASLPVSLLVVIKLCGARL